MRIRFTTHALQKFSVLERHGVFIRREQVVRAIETPDYVDHSRLPLLIAQASLDRRRVLRVVYKIKRETFVVVTFYPGKKSQYEKDN